MNTKPIYELITLAKNMAATLDNDDVGGFTEPSNHVKRLADKINEELLARPTGEEAALYMERFVNVMSNRSNEDAFVQYVVGGMHRTLQQSFLGLMFKVIVKGAEQYKLGRYDLRNEASLKACAELEPILRDIYLPFV